MTERTVDILLVEDNPNDVELMLQALKVNNLSNRIEIVRDGEEALEFLFGTGAHSDRSGAPAPNGSAGSCANSELYWLSLNQPPSS